MKLKIISDALVRVLTILTVVFICVFALFTSYFFGYTKGKDVQFNLDEIALGNLLQDINTDKASTVVYVEKTPTPTPTQVQKPAAITWSGPDLWQAVNAARVQNGVGTLNQADELCTIASIRLNELLELGKLDGHEGFSNMPERRPDLKWIFDKYGQVAEFLVSGASSAQEAVDLWYNTLGHKKLITGGEYVYGCIYGQSGFGVAITAF